MWAGNTAATELPFGLALVRLSLLKRGGLLSMTPTSEQHDHVVHGNKHYIQSVIFTLRGTRLLRMPPSLQDLSIDELNMTSNTMFDAASLTAALTSLLSRFNANSTFMGCVAIYLLGLAIYRLYLTPSAKFPGPRLAALCYWYEFYYDVWPHEGQYTWKIRKLHQEYGM